MMTADDVDRFTRRTLRTLSGLPSARRAEVIMQILEADPALAAVLPELRATIGRRPDSRKSVEAGIAVWQTRR